MTDPRRAVLDGPTYIRLLAGLAGADLRPDGAALSERLGQWIDWTHAVALSRALDGRLPAAAEGVVAAAPAGEVDGARAALAEAIARAPELAIGAPVDAEAGFAPFRERCKALQQSMLAATGRLRGRLRDRLAARPAPLDRLAEVDALMERVLGPREHALLGRVPDLLGAHFDRLRGQAGAQAGAAAAAVPPSPAVPGAWLDGFRRDMQAVLLAELDVRFHPLEGLLAALRTP